MSNNLVSYVINAFTFIIAIALFSRFNVIQIMLSLLTSVVCLSRIEVIGQEMSHGVCAGLK